MKTRIWYLAYAAAVGAVIGWLLLSQALCRGATIQTISVQNLPSFIYSWRWHLLQFGIVEVTPGDYVIEESVNMQQWRICAEFRMEYANTLVLMIQQDLGGACRFYRLAKLEGRINK